MLHASSRPRLTTTPLRFANPSPPSGWVEDFHLQTNIHARHTNGSGTDHGAGGVCFAIGPRIKGGMHGIYPDTRPEAREQGGLVPNQDFRGVYSTILEDWLRLDPVPIVNGQFEQPKFIEK